MSQLVECNPPWLSYPSDNANAPCKLTFERVVALPNARISILPLPGAQGNKHSISVCSQSHGDHNQQQARLNIGKVTSSGFQLAVLEDAEELDSFGAKASEGQRVGWPWKRMPSDCIVSVSTSVSNPFTVYRVCHSSLPKHQAKVQSILLAIGSSIKALRGHNSECVFLCVDRRDHIVGILATESILRSHTLSRAAPSPQAAHRAGIHLKQQNRPPATTGDRPRSSPHAAPLSAKQPEQPSKQLRHASTIPPAKKQLTLFQALGGSLHGRSKQSPRPAQPSRIQSTPASFCHSPEYQQTPSLDPVHAMLPCMAQCPALPSSDTCLLRPSTRCPNIPLRCSSDPPRNANRWLGAAAAPMAPGSAPDIRPHPSAPQPHHTAAMRCVHNLADELDMTPRHCTQATCLANACAHGGIPLCMRPLPDGNGTMSPCPHLQARPSGPPVRPHVKVLPRQARTHANGGRLARMRAGVTSSKADLATAHKGALVGASHDRQPHATEGRAPLGPVSNKTSTQWMQTRTSARSSDGGTVRDSSTEQPCLVTPEGSEHRQAAGWAAEELGSRPPRPLAPPGHTASDGRAVLRDSAQAAAAPRLGCPVDRCRVAGLPAPGSCIPAGHATREVCEDEHKGCAAQVRPCQQCDPHKAGVETVRAGSPRKRKKGKPRALVGVRALWVAQGYRAEDRACCVVAECLLDAARVDCGAKAGVVPQRKEVAWAPWVSDVSELAADYCGGVQNIIHYV